MKSGWQALCWQLCAGAARRGLRASILQSARLADSQPAESACSPQESPAILLRLLFSFLANIHPAWSGLSNPAPPPTLRPSLRHPPPSLFFRSTRLVKVSQSPVALLYRL